MDDEMEEYTPGTVFQILDVHNTNSFYLPGSPVIHFEWGNEPWCPAVVRMTPQVLSGALSKT